jgi:hypothetical protein
MNISHQASARHWWVVTLSLVGVLLPLTPVIHVLLTGLTPTPPDSSQLVVSPSKTPSEMAIGGETPTLLFRQTRRGDTYGKLAFMHLNYMEAPAVVANLRCDRLHFAASRGVCLSARRGVFTTYEAIIFDSSFQALHIIPLRGIPSRVRVSADGRMAAMTVFVSGHSYTATGFSTHTSIIDLQTGGFIARDLEMFTVWRAGERFHTIDSNVWGVTFRRNNHHFYATLASGGHTYLIEGDPLTQTAWVRRGDIECPALSPDDTRVAFKKRQSGTWGPVTWRLAVLQLATEHEWLLNETRNVDDQAEWLDDATVLYTLPDHTSRSAAMHTWAVPADGGGKPRLFAAHAYSPVVIRPPWSLHP